MNKKIISIAIMSMFLMVNLVGISSVAIKSTKLINAADTVEVFPGESIQDAIDNAEPGDTIFVRSGTYRETIEIDKSITLMGENRENTIIMPVEYIKLNANNININSLTFTEGILLEEASNNQIKNNKIIDFSISVAIAGIELHVGCNNNIIQDNIIEGKNKEPWGIMIYGGCSFNKILNNTISNCRTGIDLYPPDSLHKSRYNEITKNCISNCEVLGIRIIGENTNNKIIQNEISQISDDELHPTWGFGISIESYAKQNPKQNDITKNIIDSCTEASIYLCGGSTENTISKNDILNSLNYGILIEEFDRDIPINNQISLNNLINNRINAYDEGNNIWYKTNLMNKKGNYWDDWDNIGPYEISGGNNKDMYPLDSPYEEAEHNSENFRLNTIKNSGIIRNLLNKLRCFLEDINVIQSEEIEIIKNYNVQTETLLITVSPQGLLGDKCKDYLTEIVIKNNDEDSIVETLTNDDIDDGDFLFDIYYTELTEGNYTVYCSITHERLNFNDQEKNVTIDFGDNTQQYDIDFYFNPKLLESNKKPSFLRCYIPIFTKILDKLLCLRWT